MITVLRAIEGARSAPTTVDPLWTMPGHLAQHGRLTQSVTYLVDNARYSVVCSTFNFQRSSGLWKALQTSGTAARDHDEGLRGHGRGGRRTAATGVTDDGRGRGAPAARPWSCGRKRFDGRQVRNHSKFLSIDHRFLLVTSANFSWSAENANLEFGVLIDNPNLAEAVERELRDAEDLIFERVMQRADHLP